MSLETFIRINKFISDKTELFFFFKIELKNIISQEVSIKNFKVALRPTH